VAVGIEFVNVIVRKSAVERKYPGGLDGFVRQDLANYVEDEHILRVGFMSTRDALGFAETLEQVGLHHSNDPSSEVGVVIWDDPATPSWLAVGVLEGRPACWVRAEPPGRLVDLDPGMLLRCRSYGTVEEIIRVFQTCGAEVKERVPPPGTETLLFDCERGDASLQVEVFVDPVAGRPIGVYGHRDLARRASIVADVSLMRDLSSALERAEGSADRTPGP
jgi:hypothetical protein